ncbi:site-2 protease family protein [Granulicella sp. 5B5]|uniref:site-2 protease family protein n=1 Tax=Granulicella sp. 5B5 TaxID=1617967 RepID=UPI0015F5ABD3|nr:site-2 protease family protein [Granulicella sp. 5B5]QMV19021.1 site-2 protease family protein [Granulicella sp. 5B5]
MSSASAIPNVPAPPQAIHNCPVCSHWLPEGTLACPDCRALIYGQYLSQLAFEAQQLEQQQKWNEARGMWQIALTWLPAETQQAAGIAQHVTRIDAQLKAAEEQKAKWTKRLGPFAPIALFLLKIKSFLFLIFKLKFLLSFFAFFAIYWALFGFQFAAGFTLCILIHEMGHYVAVRRRGLKADMPFFLPGMGAYVRWYGQGVSRPDLAAIALAGPLFGLASALVCFAIFWGTHSPLFLVLAYTAAWLNLINLIPLLGLDGAHAVIALSALQRGLVAGTCLLFFALTLGPTLSTENVQWVFLVVGLTLLWKVFTRDQPETGDLKSFVYFQSLVIVLGALLVYTYPLVARLQP